MGSLVGFKSEFRGALLDDCGSLTCAVRVWYVCRVERGGGDEEANLGVSSGGSEG